MKQLCSKVIAFTPPYCPNSHCPHHQGGIKFSFLKNGIIRTLKPPYRNQRFICRHCRIQFSQNTFSMDFRKRKVDLNSRIFLLKAHGLTYRSIATLLNISEHAVRQRMADLARQCLIQENRRTKALRINHPVIYDGFETFCQSQFSPCYINTAVCEKSFYTIATTYSPLNRKGQMKPWQKVKNKRLREEFGAYPHSSVREETDYIIKKLLAKSSNNSLVLRSDDHPAYKASVKKFERVIHDTTPGKAARTASNPLFAINHLHLLKRHFNSAFRRQTISFAKNEAGTMDTITVGRIHKNWMKSKFAKGNAEDPDADKYSPAMAEGLVDKIMQFDDFFDLRRPHTHAEFDSKEMQLFRREWAFSRNKIVPYLGN